MSEETTRNFDGEDSFQSRVLAELAALRNSMENRFATLENRVAALESQTAAGFSTVDRRLTSVEGRVASLELKVDALDEKVDARLRDTRPIWELVLSQLEIIDEKFDVHAHDMLELRAQMERLKKRAPPAA